MNLKKNSDFEISIWRHFEVGKAYIGLAFTGI